MLSIMFRFAGQYLVVTATAGASASAAQQQQLVFSRAGQLQAASEPLPAYGSLNALSVESGSADSVAPVVAWRPAGNLIAAPQKSAGKHQVMGIIIFRQTFSPNLCVV
jgi:hypothetical protein